MTNSFELQFMLTSGFTFLGGDLIMRFEAGGSAAMSTGFSGSGSVGNLVGGCQSDSST